MVILISLASSMRGPKRNIYNICSTAKYHCPTSPRTGTRQEMSIFRGTPVIASKQFRNGLGGDSTASTIKSPGVTRYFLRVLVVLEAIVLNVFLPE